MKAKSFFVAGLAAAAVACGSGLGSTDKGPPLAVLRGQLAETQAIATSSPVRIAALWVTHGAASYMSTQDIPATPIFPSKFELELADPPPSGVTLGFSRSSTPEMPGRLAIGVLVAYEDRNGNGKLDLVKNEDPAFVDRVLGVNRALYLAYLEGNTVPPELIAKDGSSPPPGYSLMKRNVCPPMMQSDHGAPGDSTPPSNQPDCLEEALAWVPMTTFYDLALTADPKFATSMCVDGLNYAAGIEADVEGPPRASTNAGPDFYGPAKYPASIAPDPWPVAGDPMLACSPDGTTFNYKSCTEQSQGLCQPGLRSCRTALFVRPKGAVPSNWPCTITE